MFQGLVVLGSIGFALFCLFDVSMAEKEAIRSRSREYWTLVVLIPVFGGMLWFRDGRPESAGPTPGSRKAGAPRTKRPAGNLKRSAGRTQPSSASTPAPRGPDDDPAFIRALEEQLRRRNES